MGYPRKIVTCCYCGTRAALVLRGETQHELSCSRCGAPLHNLKMMPVKARAPREAAEPRRPNPARPVAPPQRQRPRRRRKGVLKKVFEEAFDLLEDIFD